MSTENALAESTAPVVTEESTPSTTEVEAVGTETATETPVADEQEAHETTEQSGSEPSGAEKRIKQLVAKQKAEEEARRKAELEREYYKGLAERGVTQPTAAQSVPQQTQTENLTAPVLDNFETYEEYERAAREYDRKLTEQSILQHLNSMKAQEAAARKQQEIAASLQKAAKEDLAFGEIYNNPALWGSLPINNDMAEVIGQSSVPVDIIKWVHNNRTEAARIAGLPPILAARELGIIEASIKNAPKPEPPKKVSAAPAPITTVNPSTPSTIDDDDLPMEEYYKRRTKEQYGR